MHQNQNQQQQQQAAFSNANNANNSNSAYLQQRVDSLQGQVQLLTQRVEHLEQYLAAYSAAIFPAAAGSAGSGATGGGGGMPLMPLPGAPPPPPPPQMVVGLAPPPDASLGNPLGYGMPKPMGSASGAGTPHFGLPGGSGSPVRATVPSFAGVPGANSSKTSSNINSNNNNSKGNKNKHSSGASDDGKSSSTGGGGTGDANTPAGAPLAAYPDAQQQQRMRDEAVMAMFASGLATPTVSPVVSQQQQAQLGFPTSDPGAPPLAPPPPPNPNSLFACNGVMAMAGSPTTMMTAAASGAYVGYYMPLAADGLVAPMANNYVGGGSFAGGGGGKGGGGGGGGGAHGSLASNAITQHFVSQSNSGNPNHNNNNSNNNNNNNMMTALTLDPVRANNDSLECASQQAYVKELNCKGCKNITRFEPLARLKQLWKLSLQGCNTHVTNDVVQLIAAHNKRLSRLNLCGCELVTDASALSRLSYLFDLNLSGCGIGNASLEAIARGCQQLSRLALNSCPNITDVSSLSNLRELKLLYCRYSGNIAVASVARVLEVIGGHLLTINVDGIAFADMPGLRFGEHGGTTALKNFNGKDNALLTSLDFLLRVPGEPAAVPTMESLDFLLHVPGASRAFPALELLDFDGCGALACFSAQGGDGGAARLLAAMPALRTLRLSHTAITQQAIDGLAATAAALPGGACPLAALYLEGCEGVTRVDGLASVPALQKVVLSAAAFSGDGEGAASVARLQARRPDVEVVLAYTHAGANNNNNNTAAAAAAPATAVVGADASATGGKHFAS